MDTKKLDKWTELLLDKGKRNNLINFKDTRTSTVEVLLWLYQSGHILSVKKRSKTAYYRPAPVQERWKEAIL